MQTQENSCPKRKVFVYGIGLIAPGSNDLDLFLSNVKQQKTYLSKDPSLYNAFLSGRPDFDFSKYKDWINSRHSPSKFRQITEKTGEKSLFSIAASIDALRCQDKLEEAVKALDPRVMVCMGSSYDDLPTIFDSARQWDKATWEWEAFWAKPEENCELDLFLKGEAIYEDIPEHPESFSEDSLQRFEAIKRWNAFWTRKNSRHTQCIADFSEIGTMKVGDNVDKGKILLMRAKSKKQKEIIEKYKCPSPPWDQISANLVWNTANASAAHVSMTLGIHGPAPTQNGACASFGVAVDEGLNAIQQGNIDVAFVGATDNTPSPELISAFYNGKVACLGNDRSVPLTSLRGIHLAGGACVWLIAAEDAMKKFDIPHMNIEILGTGLSSDAEHIITPSKEGPKLAVKKALEKSGIKTQDLNSWDMHATGTPGDPNELSLIAEFLGEETVVSARKGLWGHGMGVCGGWEITAQLLGVEKVENGFLIPATGIKKEEIHPSIKNMNIKLCLDEDVKVISSKNEFICSKLNMGVGGASSCIIAKRIFS